MKSLNAKDWTFQEHDAATSDVKHNLLLLPTGKNRAAGIDFEVRCNSPVTLNAITADGFTLFLDWGQVVSYVGRLEGFQALEVVASDHFQYRSSVKLNWFERPDQTRLTVALSDSSKKPVQDLIREELTKYLGRRAAAGVLADDVSINELLDDIENGDLDFDQEPDMFGIGHAEPYPQEQEEPAEPAPAPAASSPAQEVDSPPAPPAA